MIWSKLANVLIVYVHQTVQSLKQASVTSEQTYIFSVLMLINIKTYIKSTCNLRGTFYASKSLRLVGLKMLYSLQFTFKINIFDLKLSFLLTFQTDHEISSVAEVLNLKDDLESKIVCSYLHHSSVMVLNSMVEKILIK
jgi:hypothetical protein